MAAGNSKKRTPIKRLEESNSKGFCFIKQASSSAAKIKHLLDIAALFEYHLSTQKKKNDHLKKQGKNHPPNRIGIANIGNHDT